MTTIWWCGCGCTVCRVIENNAHCSGSDCEPGKKR